MTDIWITIERKRASAASWIAPAPRTGNNEQQYSVWLGVERSASAYIGSWRYPEGAAARWLLEHGRAERTDTLRTFHNGPAMRGSVGWFADHTVNEKGTPRIVKWSPMPEGAKSGTRVLTGTASDDGPV